MSKGIYLTAKDLITLESVTEKYAYRLLTIIRDSLGKERGQKITLKEYARYRGVDVEEIKAELQ